MANKEKILRIAKEVHDRLVYEYDSEDLKSYCLDVSRELVEELKKWSIPAKVVQGEYEVDIGVIEDDYEDEIFNLLHYWVEVGGKVLDISAKQFQEFVNEDLDEITYGKYSELYRYTPIRRGWK